MKKNTAFFLRIRLSKKKQKRKITALLKKQNEKPVQIRVRKLKQKTIVY